MSLLEWCEKLPGWKPGKDGEGVALCELHGDHNPSLWIGLKTKWGRYECRACGAKGTLVEYAELTLRQPPVILARNTGDKLGEVEAEYIYTDPAGKEILLTRRYRKPDGDKTFRQFIPNGAGWKSGGIKGAAPLYNAASLARAEKGATCYIVEGEKACIAGIKKGLLCTTAPEGAGKFGKVGDIYLDLLHPLKIVILPDNDAVGQNHARQVASILAGRGCSVAVLDLPGLPPKGDLYDWLGPVNTPEALAALVESKSAPFTLGYDPKLNDFPLTDLGNAEAIIHIYGHRLRWHSNIKEWLIWSGTHWALDRNNKATAWANKSARARRDACEGIADDKDRKKAESWAKTSESSARRDAALSQVKAFTPQVLHADQLDRNPWLISCLNGTLDLKTGILRPHDPADYITKVIPAEYDPSAKCDLWESVLHRAMDGDPRLIDYLQQSCGYSLTGVTSEHAVFILHGNGNNGKSLFMETICSLWGEYSCTTRSETFAAKDRSDSTSNALARLNGSRLVKCSETGAAFRLDEALIKGLSGEDTITARFLFKEFFDFRPTFKVWLSTNHKPIVRGTDYGIWRRLKLIPWKITIPKEEVDKGLRDKLARELTGILAWCVRGCMAWQKAGELVDPPAVVEAIEEYRKEQDLIGQFITECCSTDHPLCEEPLNLLYSGYSQWSRDSGHKAPIHKQTLTKKLSEKGYKNSRKGKLMITHIIGLKLVAVPDSSRRDEENEKPLNPHEIEVWEGLGMQNW